MHSEVVAAERGMAVINRDSTRAVNAAVLQGAVPVHAISGPAMVLAGPGVSVMCRRGEVFIGLGCNRGTKATEIEEAVGSALEEAGLDRAEVMAFATTAKKFDEAGMSEAVSNLGGNLIYLDDQTLNDQPVEQSKASLIGLKGVAEPAALAISIRKELVLRRRAYGNVTVAIAR
jgi:cobalt-precorrin 5A hydrolase